MFCDLRQALHLLWSDSFLTRLIGTSHWKCFMKVIFERCQTKPDGWHDNGWWQFGEGGDQSKGLLIKLGITLDFPSPICSKYCQKFKQNNVDIMLFDFQTFFSKHIFGNKWTSLVSPQFWIQDLDRILTLSNWTTFQIDISHTRQGNMRRNNLYGLWMNFHEDAGCCHYPLSSH